VFKDKVTIFQSQLTFECCCARADYSRMKKGDIWSRYLSSLKDLAKEFSQSTSIHGLKYIGKEDRIASERFK